MKEMTIATYNIRHGHDVDLDWSRLAEVIAASGADAVGIQEVDMHTNRVGGVDSLKGLSDATGMPYALFVPAMDYDGGQYGTAILSRYPITAAEYHPLPSAHYEPRAFGCVTLDVGEGSTLILLNTHLSYESAEQQSIQMAYLADWMAARIPADTPAVLTGDFNTEDFAMFAPLTGRGYGLVNCVEHEYKTFRTDPVAIDNIVYTAATLTPEEWGMIDRDTSDHNLFWCRFQMK